MKLLLVRHGQTTSNVAGALDTAFPGADLTDLGRAQAQALVPRLAHVHLDAIAHSPLVRTEQTLAPLARDRKLDPLVLPGLREVSAGELEMCSDEASRQRYFSVVRGWFTGQSEVLVEGEDAEAICQRFDEAINSLADAAAAAHAQALTRVQEHTHTNPGDHAPVRPLPAEPTALAVAHGTVLGVWHALRASGMSPELAVRHHLRNTEITVLTGSPGNWTIHAWGSHEQTPGTAIELLDL